MASVYIQFRYRQAYLDNRLQKFDQIINQEPGHLNVINRRRCDKKWRVISTVYKHIAEGTEIPNFRNLIPGVGVDCDECRRDVQKYQDGLNSEGPALPSYSAYFTR